VRVAGGDVTGDGVADLIVGSESRADRVRVIRMPDRAVLSEFRAYGGFSGGVNVAAGDISGDGIADIITGAGDGGGPHVKVFNGVGNGEIRSFFVSDTTSPGQQPIALSGGVRVASVDQDSDGLADVLTGLGRGARPLAQIFRVSQRSGGTISAVTTPLLAVNTFGNGFGNGIFVG
jgi:serralysin